MTTEQLQFIFSLFSFVGVVGILFYMILERAKREEQERYIGHLRDELISLKEYLYQSKEEVKETEESMVENMKEKIIALHEKGEDVAFIENNLNIPKATIEMVLKFHHLNKFNNWRESDDNDL
jgi:hypothetical protein